METGVAVSSAGKVWQIVPMNGLAGALLGVIFLYLCVRHMMFVLMFMDIVIGWLRKFAWFPKEGRRKGTIIHWFMAIALFLGFLLFAGLAGWLQFVPK